MSNYKKNIAETCQAFNIFKSVNLDRIFTREQLFSELKEVGISTNVARKIVPTFCEISQVGKHYLYKFKDTPLLKNVLTSYYKDVAKEKKTKKTPIFNTEDSIKFLENSGYKVLKWKEFNLESFKTDYPDLFEKYSIYE